MTLRILWDPVRREEPLSDNCVQLIGKRQGVMVHFDGSSSDRGSLSWFRDPKCKVSYNDLVLDDGSYATIASRDKTAFHAGVCRPSRSEFQYHEEGTSYRHTANHAFYGISIATNDKIECTVTQMITAAWIIREYFVREKWSLESDLWRITGHADECWPRSRKNDPYGSNKLNPILSLNNLRQLLPLFGEVT